MSQKKSLDDDSVVTVKKVGRRSSMQILGGTILGGVVLSAVAPERAQAVTDQDTGACADPAGNGRGGRRNCSDSDSGQCADPAGGGRSCIPPGTR